MKKGNILLKLLSMIIVFVMVTIYGLQIVEAANLYQYPAKVTNAEISGFEATMTIREFYEELEKSNNDILKYIDSPEELAKLVYPSLVSSYIDTRPENEIDKPIDWEKVVSNLDTKEIQGIIKVKRALDNGNTVSMTYVDDATFSSYLEDYHLTGSEEAKNKALTHFTLVKEQGTTTNTYTTTTNNVGTSQKITSLQGGLFIGDSILGALNNNTDISTEAQKVLYQVSARAEFFYGEQSKPNSNGNCIMEGDKFHWDSNFNIDTPKFIYLILGQNGVGSTDGIKKLVTKLQEKFPNVPIFINSVLPAGQEYAKWGVISVEEYNTKADSANIELKSYCDMTDNVYYSDVLTGYKENVDTLTPASDGLHPNAEGSKVLLENIKKNLANESVSSNSTTIQTNQTGKYMLKIATWSQETNITEHNIIEADGTKTPAENKQENNIYTMQSTKIDYLNGANINLSKFYMPFNYLWALLVVSEDKDFVFDIADLVYNSEFELTVFDNLTTTTKVQTDTYQEKKRIDLTSKIKITGEGTTTNYYLMEHEEGEEPPVEIYSHEESGKTTGYAYVDHEIIKTKINKNNTVNVALTKANSWLSDSTQEYNYAGTEKTEQPGEVQSLTDTEEVKQTDPQPDLEDTINGFINDLGKYSNKTYIEIRNQFMQMYRNNYIKEETIKNEVTRELVEYYFSQIKRTTKTDITTEKQTYVSTPATTNERVDANDTRPNFVTVLNKHYKTKSNIMSIDEWLYEGLESNEDTKNMVDLTKYLIYKATGYDTGVTEFNIEDYYNKVNSRFTEVNRVSGGMYPAGWLFTISFENEAAWDYQTGEITNYKSNYWVYNYITEDKQYYYMCNDHPGDNSNRNYGLGCCYYNNGFMNQGYFAKYGINIEDEQYQHPFESKLPVDIVNNVSIDIWKSNRKKMEEKAAQYGLTLEEHQLDAIVDIAYNYGPYSGVIDKVLQAYKNYGLDENALKNASNAMKDEYYDSDGNLVKNIRGTRRRNLFMTGEYISKSGKKIDPSKYSSGVLANGGPGTIGAYTAIASGRTYNLYIQGGDAPWAGEEYGDTSPNMALAGCGPTAEAIILSGYDGSITPSQTRKDLIDFFGKKGNYSGDVWIGDSMRRILPGIVTQTGGFNEEKIINCLKNGGQIWLIVDDCQYTSDSHCIALIDYDSSNGKVYVAHGTQNYRPYGWEELSYIQRYGRGYLYVGGV